MRILKIAYPARSGVDEETIAIHAADAVNSAKPGQKFHAFQQVVSIMALPEDIFRPAQLEIWANEHGFHKDRHDFDIELDQPLFQEKQPA